MPASGNPPTDRSARRVIIACSVMRPELSAAKGRGADGVEIRYLPQHLHRYPRRLGTVLQEAVDRAAETAAEIVLGYGLCSNAPVGLRAPAPGLIVPRVHDCIALFLGSREAYERAFQRRPGTYYLTPGWVARRRDPLGMLESDYVPRVGRADAEWALREELKHYTHIVLINTGTADPEPLRDRALENARWLDMRYEEIRGSPDYFERLVRGPYDEDRFVRIEAGELFEQDAFL